MRGHRGSCQSGGVADATPKMIVVGSGLVWDGSCNSRLPAARDLFLDVRGSALVHLGAEFIAQHERGLGFEQRHERRHARILRCKFEYHVAYHPDETNGGDATQRRR